MSKKFRIINIELIVSIILMLSLVFPIIVGIVIDSYELINNGIIRLIVFLFLYSMMQSNKVIFYIFILLLFGYFIQNIHALFSRNNYLYLYIIGTLVNGISLLVFLVLLPKRASCFNEKKTKQCIGDKN